MLGAVRALLQRVSEASVSVGGVVVGEIGGLLALVGVAGGDDEVAADRLAAEIWGLRLFADAAGNMNLSAAELGRAVLVVSQFTLYADTTRGRRPSFGPAAAGPLARPLVDRVVSQLARRRGHGGHGGVRCHDAGAAGERGTGDGDGGDLKGQALRFAGPRWRPAPAPAS